MFAQSYRQDAYVTELFGWLKQLKTGKTLSQVVKEIHEDFNEKKKTEKLGKAQVFLYSSLHAVSMLVMTPVMVEASFMDRPASSA